MLPTLIFWMIVATVWVWGYQQLRALAAMRGMEKNRTFMLFIMAWPLLPIIMAIFAALEMYTEWKRKKMLKDLHRLAISIGCDNAQADAIAAAADRISRERDEGG